MRTVVTGASGNVGRRVLDIPSKDPAGHQVLGIARRPPALGELAQDAEWSAVDLADESAEKRLVTLFRRADVVVHLAWLIQPSHDEATMRATNIDGTRRVLSAVRAAQVPAVVAASSVGAYSPGPKDRRVDESWPTEGVPTSLYSRHKRQTERM